jgi:hypothetical protein
MILALRGIFGASSCGTARWPALRLRSHGRPSDTGGYRGLLQVIGDWGGSPSQQLFLPRSLSYSPADGPFGYAQDRHARDVFLQSPVHTAGPERAAVQAMEALGHAGL